MPSSSRDLAKDVIRREAEALAALAERVGPEMDAAVEAVLACRGRVVVCGVGKSGQIARKLASTFSSTGTPAVFLHAAEGFHGDVGVVGKDDLVLAISNTGTTAEVTGLLPTLRAAGARIVAITASTKSPLARGADVVLATGEVAEADPTGLVPTVSAVLALALGDALCVAVLVRRGFTTADYARLHPGGAIGRKTTLKVEELLRGAETNPVVRSDASFRTALETVTRHTLGGVSVVDGEGRLVGIVTDGDVRRTITALGADLAGILAGPVTARMTRGPAVVAAGSLALEALRIMEDHRPRPLNVLPVIDPDGRPIGMIHVHTLVQAGLSNGRDEA